MYIVTRDCCTSGNCLHCLREPIGTTLRVEQLRTEKKEHAEEATRNWRGYNATLTEER